ncbi:hypothetical protein ACEZCY_04105 [Streptacidiphilus sp. N1-12]|uniref:Uncharacterized protein n=2 Tax=Streptacidiphilus alkalitolerans TaxID=3342712 RepID=A0ABV6W8Y5_9ACTN
MGTKEQVRQGFINLRAGVGLTAAKLEAEPLLMELLHAEDGDQAVKLLTILCEALGGEDHGIALRSALAIGYPPGQGLKWRRQQLIQPHPGRSAELPVSHSTLLRREDDAIKRLTDELVNSPTIEPTTAGAAPAVHVAAPANRARLIDRLDMRGVDLPRLLFLLLGLLLGVSLAALLKAR